MIRTKPIRNFINAREALLIRTSFSKGGTYFMETDVLPKVYETPADAIRGNDDFVQAIRFDLETLTGEDVTEECATSWLRGWNGTPADKVPAFVDGSDAFRIWSRAYDEANPGWQGPDPDQQRQEWLDEEYRHERREVPVLRQRHGLHLVTSA